jgi:hypothetical protein
MTDLWPTDLGTVTSTAPVTILKEQASLLGSRTKNIVKAKVQMTSWAPSSFAYEFVLHAPALDNYIYRLFVVAYDVELYPVKFLLDGAVAEELGLERRDSLSANNEQAFITNLSKIFATQKTRHVIHAILSQSVASSQITGNGAE